MAVNFPASPTNGQQFTTGTVTWQWDSAAAVWLIIQPASVPDAPSDGFEYVRKNNLWQPTTQRVVLNQITQQVAVPSWAKSVDGSGICYQTTTATHNLVLRFRTTSNATAFAAAGNYNWSGYIHSSSSGSFAHFNADATLSGALLTNSGNSANIPHNFEFKLNVERPVVTNNFLVRHKGTSYGSPAISYNLDGFTWLINAATTDLRMSYLEFYAGSAAVAWGSGSYVDLTWRP